MAVPKRGKVTRVERLGASAHLLEVAIEESLGFVGGQYIIVDSGLSSAQGKAIKRAYSLLTGDAEQRRFELAVQRIGDGLGSGYMHGLAPGASLTFSGPWGKFKPTQEARGRTLVLATDTGISAALGLLNGQRAAPLLARTTLIWLRQNPEYFVPDDWVRARVPSGCGEVRLQSVPHIGHPERVAFARQLLQDVLARGPLDQGFVCGDGAVNYALLEELVAAGVAATKDHVESFFNMPRKST